MEQMPKSKKAIEEPVIKITFDGIEYFVNINQVDGEDALACRKITGMSVRKVMDQLEEDPDVDLVGIAIWLAKRQAGDKKTQLSETLSKINWENSQEQLEIEVVKPEPEQVSDDPNDPNV